MASSSSVAVSCSSVDWGGGGRGEDGGGVGDGGDDGDGAKGGAGGEGGAGAGVLPRSFLVILHFMDKINAL